VKRVAVILAVTTLVWTWLFLVVSPTLAVGLLIAVGGATIWFKLRSL
jgi:hypothetical protein